MTANLIAMSQEIDNENFCGSGYSVHPMAAMFPLIEGEEFDTLVRSITNHDLKHPIILFGKAILDGRNRLRACIEAKREPRFEQYQGSEEDIFYFILQENVQRRHLNPDQRAAIVGQMQGWHLTQQAERLKREGQQSGGPAGGRGKKKTLILKSISRFKAPRTIDKLAELAEISTYKAQQVVTLLRNDADLLDEVAKGKVKLKEASKKSKKITETKKPHLLNLEEQVERAMQSIQKRAQDISPGDRSAFISAVIYSLKKLAKEIQ